MYNNNSSFRERGEFISTGSGRWRGLSPHIQIITANNFKTKTQNHHCSQVFVTCWAGTSPQEVKSAAEIERYSKMDKGKGGRRGRGIEAQQKGARARHFQECTNGPSFSLIHDMYYRANKAAPEKYLAIA